MTGWFELNKSSGDQHRFILKVGDGEIIPTSELCTIRDAAERGVASVQANNPLDGYYEKRTAANGKLCPSLKAANHRITGSSRLHANEQSHGTGIASAKANGVSQTIKDKTW